MSMPEQLAETFERIRQEQGEDAYNEARIAFVRAQAPKPGSEYVLPKWFPDLDVKSILDRLKPDLDLQALMPSIRTKTQQDVAFMCFEALRGVLDGCFTGNLTEANLAKEALDKAVDLAFKVHLVEEQVEQIPEEQRSAEAQRFITPVTRDDQDVETLLQELGEIDSMEGLQVWYSATKTRRDGVEGQALRDKLFGAIRAKKGALS